MKSVGSISIWGAIFFVLVPRAFAEGPDGKEPGEEIPVVIEEVDVTKAIKEFKDFERRLEKYRKAVTEGQKAASEIGTMLEELRKTAKKDNGFNEKAILKAINGYVDGVVQKQAGLVDFLQSQRYRISYYANKVAASVRSEDIAKLFGTRKGNLRRLRDRRRVLKDISKEVTQYIDTLSKREFSKTSFQPLPGISASKRRQLNQLNLDVFKRHHPRNRQTGGEWVIRDLGMCMSQGGN